MKSKKKELTQMEKITQGYEGFIKDKKVNNKTNKAFEKQLKKAVSKKPPSAK